MTYYYLGAKIPLATILYNESKHNILALVGKAIKWQNLSPIKFILFLKNTHTHIGTRVHLFAEKLMESWEVTTPIRPKKPVGYLSANSLLMHYAVQPTCLKWLLDHVMYCQSWKCKNDLSIKGDSTFLRPNRPVGGWQWFFVLAINCTLTFLENPRNTDLQLDYY